MSTENNRLDYLKKIGTGRTRGEPTAGDAAAEVAASLSEGAELETPFRNRKTRDAHPLMPIGFWVPDKKKFYRGYEVSELSAEALVSVDGEESNMFKAFGTLVIKGVKRIFDHETGEDLDWKAKSSKIFFPDITFLMTEILIKTKGSSLISTAYRCPQCKKYTKFENEPAAGISVSQDKGFDLLADEDTMSSLDMEDIYAVPFKEYADLTPEMWVEFSEAYQFDGVSASKYKMRIPEIGDYLTKGMRYNGNLKLIERDVFLDCLVGIDGVSPEQFKKLKLDKGVGLFNLKATDYNKIVRALNQIGFIFTDHKTHCQHCGYDYETMFDISNFFASVLKTKS
jgi:hypothetical protein